MARWYSMMVAFAGESPAELGERAFAGLRVALDFAELPPCRTWRTQGADGAWWVYAVPPGVSLGTADVPLLTAPAQLDEVAEQLYARLRDVEGFRCALAGWEVEDLFRPLPGSSDVLVEEPLARGGECPGLVVSEGLWRRHGASVRFESFAPGYVWQPYVTPGISGW
jgi:hypothetical protein